jgi:hypothetical protein
LSNSQWFGLPGQSGNPKGYAGPRERRRKEVFDIIKNLGHKDALETLSYLQHNEQIEPGLRIAAAAALAPYCHPKMQATPTPRFIDTPIDVPNFDRISDAESFLARLPVLVARGELDFQSAQELCAMTNLWIQTQYAREELAIKQFNAGSTEHEQTIRIEGGLPALPGTSIVMPVLEGKPMTNGHALEPPAPAVPQLEPTPKHQDPGPLPQEPEQKPQLPD